MKKFTKFALLALLVLPLQFAKSQVVINEVYGGGGNTSAPFNQDFVELFNLGPAAVDVSGFVVQYGSATGSTFTTIATLPANTTIAAGSFFTISAGPVGAIGAALPGVDFTGSTGTNFSATAGKVQFLNVSMAIVDFVGYGTTANAFEGLGPAPAPSNTTSAQRAIDGIDTNNNNVDFLSRLPTPDMTNALIPEPSVYMLLGVGLLICGQRFLRRKSA